MYDLASHASKETTFWLLTYFVVTILQINLEDLLVFPRMLQYIPDIWVFESMTKSIFQNFIVLNWCLFCFNLYFTHVVLILAIRLLFTLLSDMWCVSVIGLWVDFIVLNLTRYSYYLSLCLKTKFHNVFCTLAIYLAKFFRLAWKCSLRIVCYNAFVY